MQLQTYSSMIPLIETIGASRLFALAVRLTESGLRGALKYSIEVQPGG